MPRPISLVLLPGMDGTGLLFDPFVAELSNLLRPIIIRYPTDRVLGYDDLQQLVEAALPGTGPFAILAESFSGPLAMCIAARGHPRLVALITVASFVRNPVRFWPASLKWLIRPVVFQLPLLAWGIRQFLVGTDAPADLVAAVRSAVRMVQPAVMARRAREILSVDTRDALARIRVPFLYISGSRGRLVSSRNVEDLRILGERLETAFLDAPHLILQRQPVAAARVIEDFLQRRGRDT